MLGFIIAAAAGFFTPQLEAPVAKPIMAALKPYIPTIPEETRLIAFLAALLIATIGSAALNTGSALGIIIGATIGYFGTRIFTVLKKVIDGRRDTE